MASIEALSVTLRNLAAPGMTPKALRAAILERHPEASKKEVARAAFHALIEVPSQDGRAVEALHSFAIAQRAPVDDTPVSLAPRRRRKQRRAAEMAGSAP